MELGALHGPLWPHTRSSLGCSHVALAACEWFPLIRSRFPPDFPLTKSHRPRGELGATTASTYHFYYSYTQCHWCPPRSISPLTILSHVRKLASYLAMSISPRFLAVAAVLAGAMYSAATVAADTPGGSCPYPCLLPPIAGGAVNSYLRRRPRGVVAAAAQVEAMAAPAGCLAGPTRRRRPGWCLGPSLRRSAAGSRTGQRRRRPTRSCRGSRGTTSTTTPSPGRRRRRRRWAGRRRALSRRWCCSRCSWLLFFVCCRVLNKF